MEKVRVYELAKELNTTSKRLMEKLAEIDIQVKNHMSLLEEDELNALYKHIGVIKREDKKDEAEGKKPEAPVAPPVQQKQGVRRKNAPRIIRTTEIIINSQDDEDLSMSGRQRGDARGNRSRQRNDYVKTTDANTGLLAGFVRKSRSDYSTLTNSVKNATDAKNEKIAANKKEAARAEAAKTEAVKAKADKADLNEAVKPKEQESVSAETVISKKDDMPIIQDSKAKAKEKGRPKKEKQKHDATVVQGSEAATVEKGGQLDKKAEDSDALAGKITGELQAEKTQSDEATQLEKSKQKDTKQRDTKVHEARPVSEGRQGAKQQGDRPAHQGSRQQGGRSSYQGSRQQGDRQPYQGSRPQGGTGYRQGNKPLDIPKPDLTVAQKEELGSQRSENRREFVSKDIDKGARREQRKEAPRVQTSKPSRRVRTPSIDLSGKKGVSEVLSEDFILNEFYADAGSKRRRPSRQRKGKDTPVKHIPPRAVLTSITIPESLTVKELAESLKKTSAEVIKKLMAYGTMATLNQEIDFDTATVIAEEYGVKTEKAVIINDEDILFDDAEETDPDKLVSRPPVVVVMGHVDHGKTSLLDAIRSTNVIESEAGGITQHIGAYTVKINDRNITFLDTPGHEAFTSMRARGAQVTDVAILVVAADDGVMPQTVEAINHAKAADVSIIVAINKIDKPGANPDKVKQELTQHGLISEEWGGDVICVNVSAKKRENIDQLLEMVLLTADVLELKADPNRQAKGTVIEAKLDKNRGPLATVLVQRGTLKVGDSIVTGATVGRIRAMVDDKGTAVKSAGPSEPVEILGLSEVPEAGELFYAIEDERVARHLVETRKHKQKEENMNITPKVTLDDLFNQIQEGNVKELNLIIKADVQGSVEAVKQSLEKLTNEEVRVNVVHGGVGAITETDVVLADVSNAIIIGFNVRPGANVPEAAESAGVDMRLYTVIYNAIEDIEAAMKGLLDPTFKEVVTGHTEVRQIFRASGIGTIAGSYVLDGKIVRNSDVRVVRDGIVVYEGKLASLKRFKDDVKEVLQGFECGLSIEKFNDIKEKDIIESYIMEEVKR